MTQTPQPPTNPQQLRLQHQKLDEVIDAKKDELGREIRGVMRNTDAMKL